MTRKFLQLHPEDNVAVALDDLAPGTFCGVVLKESIPRGHKFSLKNISIGDTIVKYGMPIGRTTTAIPAGHRTHTHNVRTMLDETTALHFEPPNGLSCTTERETFPEKTFFSGYRRKDGRVGIRNEIWIVPLVGCINGLVRRLAEAARSLPGGMDIRTAGLEHPFGCSQLGGDLERTATILAALARHPNAAGTLIVSLGCENNTLDTFIPRLGDYEGKRIRFLQSQTPGDELRQGLDLLRDLRDQASEDCRTPIPLDEIVIGLKCGGSDAFSGITANPLLGLIADRIVVAGGSVMLTEVPEMFGAEPLLARRCVDQDVFARFVRMIDDFKTYFIQNGQTIYENPSPGNKEGGLTTLEEKSLGCVQKGGTTPIVDILDYGHTVRKRGLSLVYAPGNDLVASTVLAAAGCQIILFTTGRGTPLGTVVPTVKISSNSVLAADKPHWIDFDAGKLMDGTKAAELSRELADLILDVASGRLETKNEINNFRDIAIFKDGVTL